MSKGIANEISCAICPKARVVKTLWTPAERAFGQVLMKAFKLKVNVFVKVRVLDVIERLRSLSRLRERIRMDSPPLAGVRKA